MECGVLNHKTDLALYQVNALLLQRSLTLVAQKVRITQLHRSETYCQCYFHV